MTNQLLLSALRTFRGVSDRFQPLTPLEPNHESVVEGPCLLFLPSPERSDKERLKVPQQRTPSIWMFLTSRLAYNLDINIM